MELPICGETKAELFNCLFTFSAEFSGRFESLENSILLPSLGWSPPTKRRRAIPTTNLSILMSLNHLVTLVMPRLSLGQRSNQPSSSRLTTRTSYLSGRGQESSRHPCKKIPDQASDHFLSRRASRWFLRPRSLLQISTQRPKNPTLVRAQAGTDTHPLKSFSML